MALLNGSAIAVSEMICLWLIEMLLEADDASIAQDHCDPEANHIG